jgi:hypothetical protein
VHEGNGKYHVNYSNLGLQAYRNNYTNVLAVVTALNAAGWLHGRCGTHSNRDLRYGHGYRQPDYR